MQIIAAYGTDTVAEGVGRRNLRARGRAENDARMFHHLITAPTQPAVHADAVALNRLVASGLVTTDVI